MRERAALLADSVAYSLPDVSCRTSLASPPFPAHPSQPAYNPTQGYDRHPRLVALAQSRQGTYVAFDCRKFSRVARGQMSFPESPTPPPWTMPSPETELTVGGGRCGLWREADVAPLSSLLTSVGEFRVECPQGRGGSNPLLGTNSLLLFQRISARVFVRRLCLVGNYE